MLLKNKLRTNLILYTSFPTYKYNLKSNFFPKCNLMKLDSIFKPFHSYSGSAGKVFAIISNIDRIFLKSNNNSRLRRRGENLLQQRFSPLSPAAYCIRSSSPLFRPRVLVLGGSWWAQRFLNPCTDISSVMSEGQTGAARRLTCNEGGGSASLLLLHCRR